MDIQSLMLDRETGQQAFNDDGAPWEIGADGLTLDAALFDTGGQDVAYNDADDFQIGSDFREGGVDIVGNGEAIGWIDEDEWVEYTVDVAEAGAHTFSFITASPSDGRSITVAAEKDGVFYEESSTNVPNSGNWGNYIEGSGVTLDLQEGEQVVRLTFNGGSMDLQSLIIEQAQDQPSALNMDAGEDALGVTGIQDSSLSEQLF